MWNWVHKNKQRMNNPFISEEEYRDLYQRLGGIAQVVTTAVKQYNETLPRMMNFDPKQANESLINEAEEKAAKMFLDGVFDNVLRLRSDQ
jgi:hypothetical protein